MSTFNSNQNDIIFVEGLNVPTRIGLLDWEKLTTQVLKMDIQVTHNITDASQSDDIKDTVNYASLCQCILDFCKIEDNDLLESLAEKICAQLFKSFDMSSIQLKISKIGIIPEASAVGIQIIRQSNQY
ncbi:MAG: dihydroneopterin aldolase [Saccharospirillaceae bacterium]|nr:dihydroneopterin aldolase [Pseudomonadales bacterium]NRB81507.1 dihydroneopterin aldolase [Saccharospirillaceae bacterium]